MPEGRLSFLQQTLAEHGVRSLGFEGNVLTFAEYKRYEERLEGILLCNIGDVIEIMREIKSEEEIATIEKAQSITDAAFAELLSVLSPISTSKLPPKGTTTGFLERLTGS